jgi:uncharacterized protein YfdQ (DUF2303 family)
MPTASNAEVQAALDAVLPLHGLATLPLVPISGQPAPAFCAVPKDIRLENLKPLLDAWRPFPERKAGTASVMDLESLIALTARHQDAHSVVFARLSERDPLFQTVIDYHPISITPPADSPHAPARHLQHRIAYKPIISEPWAYWANRDTKPLTQAELAAVIEDRILDIAPLPTEDDTAANALVSVLGGRTGSQQDLLAASRGLRLREQAEVTNAQTLDTGEVEVVYRTTISDATGTPLRVPTCFSIQAPVFEGGPLYRLWMRLRFRRNEGAIVWTFARYRPDLILRDALNEMSARITAETGLPVFNGTPESAA